jgi:hypothetical protein
MAAQQYIHKSKTIVIYLQIRYYSAQGAVLAQSKDASKAQPGVLYVQNQLLQLQRVAVPPVPRHVH